MVRACSPGKSVRIGWVCFGLIKNYWSILYQKGKLCTYPMCDLDRVNIYNLTSDIERLLSDLNSGSKSNWCYSENDYE